jgi:hypothetical protein
MATNDDTIKLMDILEGYKSSSYLCTAGKVTVGYGFNMDSKGAKDRWNELNIMENFDDVYNGDEEITHFSASVLFEHYWKYCERKAMKRCIELEVGYMALPQYHKFILSDIVYNTGSLDKWYKVVRNKEPRSVLLEARRKDEDGGHSLDSRVAKIGYYFGIVSDLEDAINLGLDEARYVS